ncbi:MAG: 5-(carboxyamino)imidazole ribonucleotide mutase [Desulfovibrio sp.]|jgi:5-(carboxyamino)imidazole ribonucleotide mutase|nr:5-(carboxyamino)imidazole ribonucleotide mutase [Desulfovibrio sp.]
MTKKDVSVVILMGSKSDEALVSPCVDILQKLDISYVFTVSSAHRTPERTLTLVRECEAHGARVFICAAGMAAHLAGAVAARTTRPVIGIPISGETLGGMDALLSTVQMPTGFPVATVALNRAGARNAAWLAAQILAVSDPELNAKIEKERSLMQAEVEAAGEEISKKYDG